MKIIDLENPPPFRSSERCKKQLREGALNFTAKYFEILPPRTSDPEQDMYLLRNGNNLQYPPPPP